MDFENILFEIKDDIGVLTINRPKVLNALDDKTFSEMECLLYQLINEDKVKALIITGAGEKSFVAGADISQFTKMSPDDAAKASRRGQELFGLIENLPFPVIAAVNGYALGGGCELALAAHVRIASQNAKIGVPEVKLGLIPGYGGTQRLMRLVGKGRALQMILSGDPIDAQEAYRIGLVNKVVVLEELIEAAFDMARSFLKNGPIALRFAIEAVNHGAEITLIEGTRLESKLFGLLFSTEDMKEGVSAFLEKRKAEFKGK